MQPRRPRAVWRFCGGAAETARSPRRSPGSDLKVEEERSHGGYWWPIGLINAATAATGGLALLRGRGRNRAIAAAIAGVRSEGRGGALPRRLLVADRADQCSHGGHGRSGASAGARPKPRDRRGDRRGPI